MIEIGKEYKCCMTADRLVVVGLSDGIVQWERIAKYRSGADCIYHQSGTSEDFANAIGLLSHFSQPRSVTEAKQQGNECVICGQSCSSRAKTCSAKCRKTLSRRKSAIKCDKLEH